MKVSKSKQSGNFKRESRSELNYRISAEYEQCLLLRHSGSFIFGFDLALACMVALLYSPNAGIAALILVAL